MCRFLLISLVVFSIGSTARGVHLHQAGVFVGAATGSGDTQFATGLNYEYRLADTFGVGLLANFNWATHIQTLVGMPIVYHLGHGPKVLAAPGVSFANGDSHFAFRVGVGYDMDVAENLTVGPIFNIDSASGKKPQWVYGLTAGMGF